MIITDKQALSNKCKPVSMFEAAGVIKKLEEELARSEMPGVGLAANQVGIDAAVAIIRINEKYSWNLINPKITVQDDKILVTGEGCLSFPGKRVVTVRYNEVIVCDDNYPAGLLLWGIPAIVAQHEIDHINGITMIDRAIVLPGRNEKCPCGSGKKFKICCSGKEVVL